MDVSNINGAYSQIMTDAIQSENEGTEFSAIFEKAIESKDDEELMDACRGFESYYLQQMFNEMRKTVPEGTLTEKSPGRDTYEDLLYENYAEEMASGKGIGLAQMMYEQLSKQ